MTSEKLIILAVIGVSVVAVICPCTARFRSREKIYVSVRREGIHKYVVAISSDAGTCTGSILDKEWILTAAHCFYRDKKMIGDKKAKITAGVLNYNSGDKYPRNYYSTGVDPRPSTKQETMSKEIKVHPGFWLDRLAKYDIALVRVERPFEFNDYVASIAVAGDEWPQTDNGSDNCMSLGFGATQETKHPHLKMWNFTAAHGENACPCARRYEYKRLVCVREYLNPLLCSGDDGGPLVCGNVVRAIAHMTQRHICDNPQYPKKRCAYGPEKGLSTYMFLCPFNDWIHTYVPEVPSTPVSCKAPLVSHSLATLAILSFRELPRLWGYVNL